MLEVGLFAASLTLLVAIALIAVLIGRGYESDRQRAERHALKAERDAYRLLLKAHDIELPPATRKDQS